MLIFSLNCKVRKHSDEIYTNWVERVQKYELDLARKQIAQGQDLNLVLETMAVRIQKKILHPIILELKNIGK